MKDIVVTGVAKPITIVGLPEFGFKISNREIGILMLLSGHHYDAVCRSMSSGDGCILRWKRINENADEDYMHWATWRELDICLKIMEMAGPHMLPPDDKLAVDGMVQSFSKALIVARGEIPKWKVQI